MRSKRSNYPLYTAYYICVTKIHRVVAVAVGCGIAFFYSFFYLRSAKTIYLYRQKARFFKKKNFLYIFFITFSSIPSFTLPFFIF